MILYLYVYCIRICNTWKYIKIVNCIWQFTTHPPYHLTFWHIITILWCPLLPWWFTSIPTWWFVVGKFMLYTSQFRCGRIRWSNRPSEQLYTSRLGCDGSMHGQPNGLKVEGCQGPKRDVYRVRKKDQVLWPQNGNHVEMMEMSNLGFVCWSQVMFIKKTCHSMKQGVLKDRQKVSMSSKWRHPSSEI